MPQLHESIAQYYHERTKYDPETIAAKNQGWTGISNRCRSRNTKLALPDLKPHLKEELEAFADQPAVLWWRRLSRLLFCSYGLTANADNDGNLIYLHTPQRVAYTQLRYI